MSIAVTIPVIAIVGRPNVGKSTLFNVLTRSNDALVYDRPGVTRDRIFGQGKFGNTEHEYLVIDTGGINGDECGIDLAMAGQALKAADESDIIFWLVDAKAGLTPIDELIANQLRTLSKPVIIVANKVDGVNPDLALLDFYSLGMGEPFPIAASHKRGVNNLLDSVIENYFPKLIEENNNDDDQEFQDLEITEAEFEEDDWSEEWVEGQDGDELEVDENSTEQPQELKPIKVAIIGRPNVGKSTLVNRLLGEERVVVYDQPGTTIDSIYVPFKRFEREYILIDTAGVRKRGRITDVVEKFSIVKTLKSIQDADVVILLIDSTEQLVEQDLHLLSYAKERGKSLIIGCNKWDGLDLEHKEWVKSELDRRLLFVDYATRFFISAKHGTNVGNLWDCINQCFDSAMQGVSTPKLTSLLEEAVATHQPPLVHGHRIKLRYAHLGSNHPFVIVIHGKQTNDLPDSYKRYLSNFFQDKLKIVGTPILLVFKKNENPYAGIKNNLTPRQQYKRDRMIKFRKKAAKK